jgi:hypothetical protein
LAPNLKSPSIGTPSLLKKSLSISKYLYPFKRVSTSIRRNLFTKDDGNFTNKLGVPIDGDFKFGVLLLVFVRFLGGDTGNLYRNGFL